LPHRWYGLVHVCLPQKKSPSLSSSCFLWLMHSNSRLSIEVQLVSYCCLVRQERLLTHKQDI
jgi:hypothetical protein